MRRDPAVTDNRLLPRAFQTAAGDRIYNALWHGFPRADQQASEAGYIFMEARLLVASYLSGWRRRLHPCHAVARLPVRQKQKKKKKQAG